MRPRLEYWLLCIAPLWAVWLPAAAEAHSIYIFAYPESSQICTSSYFGGKAKVRGGQVSMLTVSGQVLATAQTDGQGQVCFERPEAPQDLIFRVEASGGHQAEFKLPASAVEAGREAPGARAEAAVSAASAAPCADGLSRDDLHKALAPIMLKLAEMESRQNSRVNLRDIFGGLGWIAGLAGAALWALRKNTAGTGKKP